MRYLDLPGDESPIVWLHGVVCSSTAELLPVAVEPKLSNHRSLVLDFLGYGYSDRPEEFDYTVDGHAWTVISLLEELEIQSCHLVGHSFGGTVAVHVAAERPDLVRSLVVAEPNLDPGVTGGPSAPISGSDGGGVRSDRIPEADRGARRFSSRGPRWHQRPPLRYVPDDVAPRGSSDRHVACWGDRSVDKAPSQRLRNPSDFRGGGVERGGRGSGFDRIRCSLGHRPGSRPPDGSSESGRLRGGDLAFTGRRVTLL